MNIEQEILAMAGKRMAEQIDIEVLKGLGVHKDVKLICDTGTVYGLRYYTVEPINLEWQDTRRMWDDMFLWCQAQFGTPGDLWEQTKNLTPEPNARWYSNNSKFWFRNEAERTMFLLRWS